MSVSWWCRWYLPSARGRRFWASPPGPNVFSVTALAVFAPDCFVRETAQESIHSEGALFSVPVESHTHTAPLTTHPHVPASLSTSTSPHSGQLASCPTQPIIKCAVALSISSVAPSIIPLTLMQDNCLFMGLSPTFNSKLLQGRNS